MGIFSNKEAEEARLELAEYKKEEAKEKRLNTKKHKEELESIQDRHNKIVRDLTDKIDVSNRKLKVAEEDAKVLNAEVKRYTDIKLKEIKLDEREKILKAKEEAQETYKSEIKKLQSEVESAEKTGYNKGYADGTVDGVRKGLEHSADDRKMMAQIAAISAASHVPEATTAIAKEVANGIAKDLQGELPATTGSKNRKA